LIHTPTFRFAPSPNGRLHLGHAYSALLNADLARAASGRLLVRLEDIDVMRCRPEWIASTLNDLTWLGVQWETPVRRQSEHFADYQGALDRLHAMELLYPAFMSRGEINRAAGSTGLRDPDGVPFYPGLDRNLSKSEADERIASGRPFAWRLRMMEATARAGSLTFQDRERGLVVADPARWGDVILARKDVPTSYHLAVAVDDALQGVTDVVRGEDLLAATDVQRLLQALLGLPEPSYRHHRLIRDETGRKLSKSDGDASLASLRHAGATPADIRGFIGLPN
jgi:glutamyl-Q tRNA(Asp) synthetase